MMDAEGLITFSTERGRDRAQRGSRRGGLLRLPCSGRAAPPRRAARAQPRLRRTATTASSASSRRSTTSRPARRPRATRTRRSRRCSASSTWGCRSPGSTRRPRASAGVRSSPAAAAAALLGTFAWFFTRHHLIRPVAALVQATRRVARDQLELEIPVTWSGELGLLGASFNEMTRSLRKAKGDLDTLMHGLEREVQERTEALRAAQDQLVRNEKLSSLGKLSASIAHEINNPLAGILTFSKLIVRTLEQGVPDDATRRALIKHLLLVERETERCSAIVRNLLDFARERPLAVKDVDVNAVIEEALLLLANQIHIQGVTLEKSLGEVPVVAADFGQLRQAYVNVIMNACEAMGRGGVLTIESALVDDGRWVEVVFTDTGPGIAPEHLSKIFDPFFTTKERGTGLGLSVVYGIIERHGGKIESEERGGEGDAHRAPPPAAARGRGARGGGTMNGRGARGGGEEPAATAGNGNALDLRVVDR